MNEKTIVSKSIHVMSLKRHFWEKSVQTILGIEDTDCQLINWRLFETTKAWKLMEKKDMGEGIIRNISVRKYAHLWHKNKLGNYRILGEEGQVWRETGDGKWELVVNWWCNENDADKQEEEWLFLMGFWEAWIKGSKIGGRVSKLKAVQRADLSFIYDVS